MIGEGRSFDPCGSKSSSSSDDKRESFGGISRGPSSSRLRVGNVNETSSWLIEQSISIIVWFESAIAWMFEAEVGRDASLLNQIPVTNDLSDPLHQAYSIRLIERGRPGWIQIYYMIFVRWLGTLFRAYPGLGTFSLWWRQLPLADLRCVDGCMIQVQHVHFHHITFDIQYWVNLWMVGHAQSTSDVVSYLSTKLALT